MANIFDKTDLTDHENLTLTDDNNQIPNWIDQINAGGTVYDIATHHKITFKEGNTGKGVAWNGLTDLEIVIPTITDLVQNPVVFAGTVGTDSDNSDNDNTGKITWTNGYGPEPKDGYLLFVTDSCTFGEYTCEGGDMAVYANGEWNIVSGEEQVKIVGDNGSDKTFTIGSTEQSVLNVEGKNLKLKLAELKVDKSNNDKKIVQVEDVTLKEQYIKLEKTDDVNISETYSFEKATTLASGKVTFGTNLVTGVSFGSFDAGSLPSVLMSSKTIAVSGGDLTVGSGSDFITTVSINKPGFFVEAESGDDNKITMIDSITPVSGSKQFYTDIETTTSTSDADLTIAGVVTPKDGMDTTFIKGFANKASTVLTEFTPCSFALDTSSNVIATGFETESSSKGNNGVVSEVTVSANNDTDVLNSATVSGHVLTFGSTKVASNVTSNCKYKNLTTTTYTFEPGSATKTTIETGGFTQASSVYYKFLKDYETVVSYTPKMWKIGDSALTVGSGSYTIGSMFANVPSDTFVTYMSSGVLPSWQEGSISSTSDIDAYVSTVLSTTTDTIYCLTSDSVIMGGYRLVTTTSDVSDVVAVAAPQTIEIDATVDLRDYVTNVSYTS